MILSSLTEKGAYALHMSLENPINLRIGKLGIFSFPAGDYVYVGSALGSGGLRGRVGRHIRSRKRFHWHIDWLSQVARLIGCCYVITDQRLECQWSKALLACEDAYFPAQGFGASDCRNKTEPCEAHLVMLKAGVTPRRLRKILVSGEETPLEYFPFIFDSKHGLVHME